MNPFRSPLIAGNWKMNAGGRDAISLARTVARHAGALRRVELVVAPPFTALAAVAHEIETTAGSLDVAANEDGRRGVGMAGQNMHAKDKGAFTGEISAPMLKDSGAAWVIIGHSERRQFFGETDPIVTEKVDSAFNSGIRPIICVGETLEERESGSTMAVVERQVRAFMNHLLREPGFAVVAYEPVWAIGTGKVASPEDAQEVHGRIRALLEEVSEEVAEMTRILYGGSVKPDNAEGLLGQDDIDGALVGGAALDAISFVQIAEAAQRIAERSDEDSKGESNGTEAPTTEEGPSPEPAGGESAKFVGAQASEGESSEESQTAASSEEPPTPEEAPADSPGAVPSEPPPSGKVGRGKKKKAIEQAELPLAASAGPDEAPPEEKEPKEPPPPAEEPPPPIEEPPPPVEEPPPPVEEPPPAVVEASSREQGHESASAHTEAEVGHTPVFDPDSGSGGDPV